MESKDKFRVYTLMYHRVSNDIKDIITISPSSFERQLQTLRKFFYLPDPLEIIDKFKNNKFTDLPSNTVLITFDDGYQDVFQNALPLLRKYQIKALVFLTSGFMGKYNLWNHKYPQQIRHMSINEAKRAKDIFVYGCHTVNHYNLNKMSQSAMFQEIDDCKKYLERIVPYPVEYMSYPFGFFNERVIKITKKLFPVAFSTYNKGLNFSWGPNPYAVRRIDPLSCQANKIAEYIFRFRNNYLYP